MGVSDELTTDLFGTPQERQERAIEGAISASDDWNEREDILEDIKTNSQITAPASEVGFGPTGEPATEVLTGDGSGSGSDAIGSTGGGDNVVQNPGNGPGTTSAPDTSPPGLSDPGDIPIVGVVGVMAAGLLAWVLA